MSYRVFFTFSSGISKTMRVPKGVLAKVREHVASMEKTLGLTTERLIDDTTHWSEQSKRFEGLDNKTVCKAVEEHNHFVRWFYGVLAGAKKLKAADAENLSPEDAQSFWHALEMLDVPPERWTGDYYRDRMETLYEVMRGRETDGISFDAPALSEEQAGAVIVLFSAFLDTHDIRLDVPVGHDRLASSCSGEYVWCAKCGAVDSDEVVYTDDTDDEEDEDAEEVASCPFCKAILD